jgi:hypothetical protein
LKKRFNLKFWVLSLAHLGEKVKANESNWGFSLWRILERKLKQMNQILVSSLAHLGEKVKANEFKLSLFNCRKNPLYFMRLISLFCHSFLTLVLKTKNPK